VKGGKYMASSSSKNGLAVAGAIVTLVCAVLIGGLFFFQYGVIVGSIFIVLQLATIVLSILILIGDNSNKYGLVLGSGIFILITANLIGGILLIVAGAKNK
jgi:hypothetical protein